MHGPTCIFRASLTLSFLAQDLGALVGSLDLLSMGLELAIQRIIAANDGFFMANGPPVTRTIMEGRFGVHF